MEDMPKDGSVVCANCDTALDETEAIPLESRKRCPVCGSVNRKYFKNAKVTVKVMTKVGIKGRHPGKRRPFIETVSGHDLYRKTGKWNILKRVIDRENDEYAKIVTDPDTGEVLHHCEEPLHKHRGHGSAKNKTRP